MQNQNDQNEDGDKRNFCLEHWDFGHFDIV
jgi:hypothetical protein